MRLWYLAVSLVLAACASQPTLGSRQPARDELQRFEMSARFALRTERPNEAAQNASGRLLWRHDGKGEQILVSTPLGQGIAEITVGSAGAQLRTSNGQIRRAADASNLLASVTGYSLPLAELPAWLLGHPSPAGTVSRDDKGRPLRLKDSGWRIEYDYIDDSAAAAPSRLIIQRDSELELRLRVEDWQPLDHDRE